LAFTGFQRKNENSSGCFEISADISKHPLENGKFRWKTKKSAEINLFQRKCPGIPLESKKFRWKIKRLPDVFEFPLEIKNIRRKKLFPAEVKKFRWKIEKLTEKNTLPLVNRNIRWKNQISADIEKHPLEIRNSSGCFIFPAEVANLRRTA
jgi:hypothetical protein